MSHRIRLALLSIVLIVLGGRLHAEDEVTRVFVFAGQSNMVGSDSKVGDIGRFPPFVGLEEPQEGVLFSYVLGREDKVRSDGWVSLQAVDGVVGPELSFARHVTRNIDAPIAIMRISDSRGTVPVPRHAQSASGRPQS